MYTDRNVHMAHSGCCINIRVYIVVTITLHIFTPVFIEVRERERD